MKNKKIFIFLVFILVIIAAWIYLEDIREYGRIYSNKQSLCNEFAQSYLRTIQKTDNINDFGSEKWNMAVDIETDLNNLCMLDIKKEALQNYKSTIIDKYKRQSLNKDPKAAIIK